MVDLRIFGSGTILTQILSQYYYVYQTYQSRIRNYKDKFDNATSLQVARLQITVQDLIII